MSDKLYRAKRTDAETEVTVNGTPLAAPEPIEIDGEVLRAASFAWGDVSEGSQYLAYCIMHDFAPERVKEMSQMLFHDFTSEISYDEWSLTGEQLKEGIAFWDEVMRIRPGEEPARLTVPRFIYRAFIKPTNLPGQTLKPEDIEQAIQNLRTHSTTDAALIEGVDASSLAPLLRATK
jgi:hypothetical protein